MSEDQTEHAKLSPSGSKKWFACPGSLTLEAPFPNNSNTYSDSGSCMHSVAAALLTGTSAIPNDIGDVRLVADEYVGELIPVNGKDELPRYVRFSDEMADLVRDYVDSLRAMAQGEPIMVEQRVNFSEFVQVPGQFGTLDAGIHFVMDGELFIGDLKTGHTPVEILGNTQLRFYGLGLLRMLLDNDLGTTHTEPFAYARALGINTIRFGIYQPKVNAGWVEDTCSLDDLQAFAVLARSKAISTINAERDYGKVPDDEWERTYLNQDPNDKDCAFCRAMATCPSVARKVQETVGAEFQEVVEAGAAPAVTVDHSPEALAAAMVAAPLLEDWSKAVRAEVERRLLAGLEVPGFGLELGRQGPRKFKDERAIEALVRKRWRIKMEFVYDMSLKSPTGMEKLTKPMKVPDENGNFVAIKPVIGPRQWDTLQEYITRSDPKPSVKPMHTIKKPYNPTQPDAGDFAATKE
jgi:Protein of unknown function (DUF2800)